jgi:hypothetical protein
MNIPGISTNGLLMMHAGIASALAVDDNTAPGKDKPYEVRESPGWKEYADKIEQVLTARAVPFTKIGL